MATMTYSEQLRHPSWQRKRLEIMQRDEFSCKVCSSNDVTLNVHHKRYVKGRMPWEYSNNELVTLCEVCHGLAHEESDAFKEMTVQLPMDGPGCLHNAMGLLAGWANGEQGNDFSSYLQVEPFNYVLGEVASQISAKCSMAQLFELQEALSGRDRYTVMAAISAFVHDLKTRPDAAPPAMRTGDYEL